ncbi:MAG: dihydrodipicolinate synthase family protein, partial [Oscillospiraceae bacterium]
MMTNLEKFKGVFPAFPACYDEKGNVSVERNKMLVEYCRAKGASGVYITGSSGEFVYQSVEERKLIMSSVTQAAAGKFTVIAHVAANSTKDSVTLASFANECGCDAISSVPPYYFALPDYGVMEYWNAMIEAAKLPFILYNIPSNTGVSITVDIFKKMLENPYVIGMKNTSLPVMDILRFKSCGEDRCVIFNGPDEQFVAGRLMGADSGIGSTYLAMLDLYLKANEHIESGDYVSAAEIQKLITTNIFEILSMHGHLASSLKYILHKQGLEIGEARLPLVSVNESD